MSSPIALKQERTLAIRQHLLAIAKSIAGEVLLPQSWWQRVRLMESSMDVKDYAQVEELLRAIHARLPGAGSQEQLAVAHKWPATAGMPTE
jgi:hypothetical protein